MRRRPVALLLWIVAMCLPAAWLAYRVAPLGRWFDRLFGSLAAHVWMHALLFAVLALLLTSSLRRPDGSLPWPRVLAAILLVACLQEAVQLVTKGRAPGFDEWRDIGVDLAGSALGLLPAFVRRPRGRR